MNGKLILANGMEFAGRLSGACKPAMGEVVFTTGMTGYWETLTDPSYAGQMITMTYPIQGNYGVNQISGESDRVWAKGLIVREFCAYPNHYLSEGTLEHFLTNNHVTAISELDTRALVRVLRSSGVMNGIIVPESFDKAEALLSLSQMEQPDYVLEVACKTKHEIPGEGTHVAVVDFGAKNNILRMLKGLSCRITVFPPTATADDILAVKPDGLLLSNGPGAPELRVDAVKVVQELAGKLPIAGICLGHQIIALAMGAKTYKLPFGHRGGNHPVKDLSKNQVRMTSQNHGYAVEWESVKQTELEVTHVQINDNTVEGLKHKRLPLISLQYHPEGSPGPQDSAHYFRDFVRFFQESKV